MSRSPPADASRAACAGQLGVARIVRMRDAHVRSTGRSGTTTSKRRVIASCNILL